MTNNNNNNEQAEVALAIAPIAANTSTKKSSKTADQQTAKLLRKFASSMGKFFLKYSIIYF